MLKLLFGAGKARARDSRAGQSVPLKQEPIADALPSAETRSPQAVSPVVAVLGAKGGVGATTIAVNLGFALAKLRGDTTLVDANFQQPDAATLVAREPRYSLLELAGRPVDPDRHMLESCSINLADLGAPVNLLSPPLSGEAGWRGDLTQLARCLDKMRKLSAIWVIDLPKHLDKHLVTLLDRCDRIVLVFEATITGVAACRRWLTVFKDLGYPTERIICVLNRSGSKKAGIEKQLTACFGDQPIVRIPNAYAAAWDCSTDGRPLVLAHPHHSYSKAVKRLAAEFIAVQNANQVRTGGTQDVQPAGNRQPTRTARALAPVSLAPMVDPEKR